MRAHLASGTESVLNLRLSNTELAKAALDTTFVAFSLCCSNRLFHRLAVRDVLSEYADLAAACFDNFVEPQHLPFDVDLVCLGPG